MKITYRKIELGYGDISSAVDVLSQYKERGELVYGEFNGQKLYSDIDDIDSAYQKILGVTKKEHEATVKKQQEEYEENERRHNESIPELTVQWIEKGKSILDEKYHKLWEECVPIRLSDLYQGMELGCTLEIVEPLNRGKLLKMLRRF